MPAETGADVAQVEVGVYIHFVADALIAGPGRYNIVVFEQHLAGVVR